MMTKGVFELITRTSLLMHVSCMMAISCTFQNAEIEPTNSDNDDNCNDNENDNYGQTNEHTNQVEQILLLMQRDAIMISTITEIRKRIKRFWRRITWLTSVPQNRIYIYIRTTRYLMEQYFPKTKARAHSPGSVQREHMIFS